MFSVWVLSRKWNNYIINLNYWYDKLSSATLSYLWQPQSQNEYLAAKTVYYLLNNRNEWQYILYMHASSLKSLWDNVSANEVIAIAGHPFNQTSKVISKLISLRLPPWLINIIYAAKEGDIYLVITAEVRAMPQTALHHREQRNMRAEANTDPKSQSDIPYVANTLIISQILFG